VTAFHIHNKFRPGVPVFCIAALLERSKNAVQSLKWVLVFRLMLYQLQFLCIQESTSPICAFSKGQAPLMWRFRYHHTRFYPHSIFVSLGTIAISFHHGQGDFSFDDRPRTLMHVHPPTYHTI